MIAKYLILLLVILALVTTSWAIYLWFDKIEMRPVYIWAWGFLTGEMAGIVMWSILNMEKK